MRHRLFFYGTLVPVLVMLGLLYVEYEDGKQIVTDTHTRSNRQIELMSISHQAKVDDLSMRHMAITHRLQEHHTEEINELVVYYSTMIDNISNKED